MYIKKTMTDEYFNEVFQQTSIIPITNLEIGDTCPVGTWEISSGSDVTEPICSEIDQTVCTNIHPDGYASWETEHSNISSNGSVVCTFPKRALNDPSTVDNITKAKKNNKIIIESIPCNIEKAESDLGYCFGTADYCPKDIYTGKPQKYCSRLTAIANFEARNKFNEGKSEECKACYINDKQYTGNYYSNMKSWCTSDNITYKTSPIHRQDCLCYNPGYTETTASGVTVPRDPFLGFLTDGIETTVWDKIINSPKYDYLIKARGIWYNPCNSKAYLRPILSSVLPKDKTITSMCKDVDSMIKKISIDYKIDEDIVKKFKGVVICYTNGKFDPPSSIPGSKKNTFWNKYKWYILAIGAIIFLIIIAIVGHYINKNDKKKKIKKKKI